MSSHAAGELPAPKTGFIKDQIAREQERVVQLSRQLELKNLKDKAKILKRQVLGTGAMTEELRQGTMESVMGVMGTDPLGVSYRFMT